MKRIIFFVSERVASDYQSQRKASIFDVAVQALTKELGADNVKNVKVDKQTLSVDVKCDAPNDALSNFFYNAIQLNAKDQYETNISVFNVAEKPNTQSLFEKLQKKSGNEFTNYVKMVNGLRNELQSVVKGQQHVINEVVSGLLNSKIYDNDEKYPFACFTFLGPCGTGKTLMARTIASYLEREAKMPCKAFDKSCYTKEESFVGKILEFVYANPACVLVFDDAEEFFGASGNVLGEILNTGKFSGVSFNKAILIFTSRIGKGIYSASYTGNLSTVSKELVEQAMLYEETEKSVDGRMEYYLVHGLTRGKVVMFNYLEMATLKQIVENELDKAFSAFNQKTGIEVTYDRDKLSTLILYMNKKGFDASSINEYINEFLVKELTDMFSQVNDKNGEPLLCSLNKISYEISLKNSSSVVKELFKNKTLRALIVCDKAEKRFFERLKAKYVDIIVATSPEEAKKALTAGVDFIMLDVLANPRKMVSIPSSLEDYSTQGVDVYEYVRGYFAELPLYLISNEVQKVQLAKYNVFLAELAKDVIYYNVENPKELTAKIGEIERAIELRSDIASLIRANKVLSYEATQEVSEDAKSVVVHISELSLEHLKRDVDSKHLAGLATIVKFDDVIGHVNAKKILSHYCGFLTKRNAYKTSVAQAPKGFLIYGPEGVGKAMLARAVAGETNATLICHNAYELLSRTYSSLEAFGNRIQNLFKQAQQSSPCVVLVEDFDAILSHGSGLVIKTFFDELNALNQDPKHPILFIATTRYDKEAYSSDVINLFERAIGLSYPRKSEREIFVKRYLDRKGINTLSEETIANFVTRTVYATYSEIETILDFMVRNARGQAITDAMLIEAFDLYEFGEENAHSSNEDALRVAYHEMGHYLVGYLTGDRPAFVTIVARGNYGGYTTIDQHEDEDFINTRQNYLNAIARSFAGRAAEYVVYGEDGINSGLASDILSATRSAKIMVCRLGMGKFLYATQAIGDDNIPDAMLEEIDAILHSEYERAVKLLTDNRDKLDKLSHALAEKKYLTGDECERILAEK